MLRPHAAGEGRSIAVGGLLGAAVVVLHVAQPWPLKWILDYLTDAGRSGSVVAWVAEAPARGVIALSLLFVGLSFATALAQYNQVLVLNGLGNRVLYRFRAALFAHVLRQPLAFHESREVGELLTRIVYDTSRLRRGLNGILTKIFQTVALFAATIAVLLWLNLVLGLVLATGGVLALRAMHGRGRRIARAAKKQRKKEGALAALVANELLSIRELQAFGMGGSTVQQRFASRSDRSLRQEQKVRRLAAGLSLRVETLLAISIAVALWLGTREVMAGQLTPGDLVIFFSYAVTLRTPFARFARQTARLGRTWACGERLARIAERVPEITDEPGAVAAPPLEGRIVLEDVAVKTPKRRRTGRKWSLDGLTCEFPAGKRVAVLGSNGAGKSTLLRVVLRLADPRRGRVLLDGSDFETFTLDSVRSQMSVVFQDSVLSGLTVRENLALGTPDAALDAVQAAAARARASDFIERLPAGYDTPVRRGGNLFSGGERQRLAIARALLRDGRIWLLDEPLSGLDRTTAHELTEVLFDVTEGRTTLWVTHDPALVPRFDWIVVLDHGTSVFTGPTEDYLAWLGTRSRSSPDIPEVQTCKR
ncbi:MAG: ABC transporter ATP-binding protein [Gemmatimonadota bacterium]